MHAIRLNTCVPVFQSSMPVGRPYYGQLPTKARIDGTYRGQMTTFRPSQLRSLQPDPKAQRLQYPRFCSFFR